MFKSAPQKKITEERVLLQTATIIHILGEIVPVRLKGSTIIKKTTIEIMHAIEIHEIRKNDQGLVSAPTADRYIMT